MVTALINRSIEKLNADFPDRHFDRVAALAACAFPEVIGCLWRGGAGGQAEPLMGPRGPRCDEKARLIISARLMRP